MSTIFTPKVRAWIYRIIVSAAPLAVFYGLLTSEAAALWTALIATLLGNGLAALNTSTKDPES
jgi:hypothetical protein